MHLANAREKIGYLEQLLKKQRVELLSTGKLIFDREQ